MFLYFSTLYAHAQLVQDLSSTKSLSSRKFGYIRNITIKVKDVFDNGELESVYKVINDLKISTKTEVVRRELLFKEGDVFDSFLLEESVRNLRAIPYLREVSIIPSWDGQYVDLLVSVQDTWTLYPVLSFASNSGTKKSSVGLIESNAFGYGKRIDLYQARDEGRDKTEIIWDDRRFLGTNDQLTFGHFERSDGRRSFGVFSKPFRSFVDPYAWSLKADVYDLTGRLFENGSESYLYRQQRTVFSGGYTLSKGEPGTFVRRYTLGYEASSDEFSQADEQDFKDANVDPYSVSRDPNMLANDREAFGPYFVYQQVVPDFISLNYIDRFERVEDFNLGSDFIARMHLFPSFFGADYSGASFQMSESQGWRFSSKAFLRAAINSGIYSDEKNGFYQGILGPELKYYNLLGRKSLGDVDLGLHTLAISFIADQGMRLNKDFQFLMGGSSGLRGYSDREFSGNSSVLFNVEDRIHIAEDIFRLVNLGGAVFFDAGGAANSGLGDVLSERLYSDVGLGLRFGLLRSTGGTVIRVDLAFPLRDAPDGTPAYEPRLLISAGQAFDARLRSEYPTLESSRLSSGFIK